MVSWRNVYLRHSALSVCKYYCNTRCNSDAVESLLFNIWLKDGYDILCCSNKILFSSTRVIYDFYRCENLSDDNDFVVVVVVKSNTLFNLISNYIRYFSRKHAISTLLFSERNIVQLEHSHSASFNKSNVIKTAWKLCWESLIWSFSISSSTSSTPKAKSPN